MEVLWNSRCSSENLDEFVLSCHFFDGASKGNPGISGAGGMVYSPDSLTKSSYSWGIGSLTNNQAECYSLLMASQIALENGYKSVQIFGDSEMLIKAINFVDSFSNFALNTILKRIRKTLKGFDKVESFHILRGLNNLADALANKSCFIPQGSLCINGATKFFHPIP